MISAMEFPREAMPRRGHIVAEYLTTVTNPKLRKASAMDRLSEHQIKVYLSRALNTTGVVDLTLKCLLTGSNQ